MPRHVVDAEARSPPLAARDPARRRRRSKISLQGGRYVETAALLHGYFGHSYVAKGEDDFSDLPLAAELSYNIERLHLDDLPSREEKRP